MNTFTERAANTGRDDRESAGIGALSAENQSRAVMAQLVHDVVAEAMRLGLHDAPGDPRHAREQRMKTDG